MGLPVRSRPTVPFTRTPGEGCHRPGKNKVTWGEKESQSGFLVLPEPGSTNVGGWDLLLGSRVSRGGTWTRTLPLLPESGSPRETQSGVISWKQVPQVTTDPGPVACDRDNLRPRVPRYPLKDGVYGAPDGSLSRVRGSDEDRGPRNKSRGVVPDGTGGTGSVGSPVPARGTARLNFPVSRTRLVSPVIAGPVGDSSPGTEGN